MTGKWSLKTSWWIPAKAIIISKPNTEENTANKIKFSIKQKLKLKTFVIKRENQYFNLKQWFCIIHFCTWLRSKDDYHSLKYFMT